MKKTIASRPIRSIVGIAMLIAMQSAIAAPSAMDEKMLLQVEGALCSAFQSNNAAAIEKYEDAQYTLTNSHGQVTGRAQDVDDAKKGDTHYDEFRNHDQKVRLYGDTAVINGITTAKGTSGGKTFDADFQYTDTWIKRDGKWTLVSSHATKVERK
jgi:ketosteroid isomerase-like protein